MCTSFLMNKKSALFGRSMDIPYALGGAVVITPRNYEIRLRREPSVGSHYAIIGMGFVMEDYPLYFEAQNEKGLVMSGLNFPGNAYYSDEEKTDKINIAPFEIIPFVLSQCASLSEAVELLGNIHLLNINFKEALPLSPLHWHIADKGGSAVFEVTRSGARIFDNPVKVMTNNPTFDFHLANLGNYLNLTPYEPKGLFEGVGVKPFATGLGGVGLPGDFSSASRFVKTAYLLSASPEEDCDVSQAFHILSAVSMLKGSVMTDSGEKDMTEYTAVMDMEEGVYYYRTYGNSRISAVSLKNAELDGKELIPFTATQGQDIFYHN